jgi:hypothetical protein
MSEHLARARRKIFLRRGLAGVSAVLSAVVFTWAIVQRTTIESPRGELLKELPYNDATKAAVDIRVQQTNNLAEFALVALGALWALVIAKRDEASIGLRDPELIMFLGPSCSLVLSGIWHEFYLDKLGYFYLLGAKTCFSATEKCLPDVFESKQLNMLYAFQTGFLLMGAGQALITLLSANRLKERK